MSFRDYLQEMEEEGPRAQAKARSEHAKEEARLCKASVYFKFSGNRTRNRTFPGSMDKRGRELILEWSRQFRAGVSIRQRHNRDDRTVHTTAKRRKLAVITRERAFEWFRVSQEKYALMFRESDKAGGLDADGAVKIGPYPVPPAKVVQFEPSVFVRGEENTDYIEIMWDDQTQFPEMPEIWWLNFGRTRVPIIALEHGRGAFFNATEIPVGKYKIHDVAFEVRNEPDSSSSSGDGTVATAMVETVTSKRGSKSKKRSRSRQSTIIIKDCKSDNTNSGVATGYFVGNDGKQQSTGPSSSAVQQGSQTRPIVSDLQCDTKRRKIAADGNVLQYGDVRTDGGESYSLAEHPPASSSSSSGDSTSTTEEMLTFPGDSQSVVSQENYLTNRHPATMAEARKIRRMRAELVDVLTTGHVASCPEVVSGWSLLRFLRGANNNVARAVELFRLHVNVREELKWHEARERVVSSPNFDPLHFTMDDIIHGSRIKAHWRMTPCAGYTKTGDPLGIVLLPDSDNWIDILLSEVNDEQPRLFRRGREFFSEFLVRRQLQLDALSREQGKMVCVEMIWDFTGGVRNSFWRNFARSEYRGFQQGHNRMIGSCPNIRGRVHVIGASWLMRMSFRCLSWITDALVRRKIVMYTGSNSDAYRSLCAKIGMGSLATVIEHISELNSAGVVTSFALPKDMAPIHAPMAGAEGGQQLQDGDVSRTPTEPGSTKEIIPVQCVVRRGDIKLRLGASHEVMIEVDPNRTSAVRWKFSAQAKPLAFSAVFFRMNHDSNDPMLNDVKVVPLTHLTKGEGLIEVRETGCLLLRWANERPSALIFWSSCMRGETSVNCNYEVECVPRNKDGFAASAIGLLMLSGA